MSDALLGLDVGTTSTKAVLFDLEGKELARAVPIRTTIISHNRAG